MDAVQKVSERQPVAAHLERNQTLRVESVHGAACELRGVRARSSIKLNSWVCMESVRRAPITGSSAGNHARTAASAGTKQRQLWPSLTTSAHCMAHIGPWHAIPAPPSSPCTSLSNCLSTSWFNCLTIKGVHPGVPCKHEQRRRHWHAGRTLHRGGEMSVIQAPGCVTFRASQPAKDTGAKRSAEVELEGAHRGSAGSRPCATAPQSCWGS